LGRGVGSSEGPAGGRDGGRPARCRRVRKEPRALGVKPQQRARYPWPCRTSRLLGRNQAQTTQQQPATPPSLPYPCGRRLRLLLLLHAGKAPPRAALCRLRLRGAQRRRLERQPRDEAGDLQWESRWSRSVGPRVRHEAASGLPRPGHALPKHTHTRRLSSTRPTSPASWTHCDNSSSVHWSGPLGPPAPLQPPSHAFPRASPASLDASAGHGLPGLHCQSCYHF
jgi:hypothetical protein